jgi:ABC-type polysaccharide/polyol phosphate transport system ATPase subunit
VIPDSGTIQVDGKVTGLLELGTGFNAEMTGLENIYMNGTLIGMTKDELDRKKQTIIDFSELGEFINEPIKTYSSGMTMRLRVLDCNSCGPDVFFSGRGTVCRGCIFPAEVHAEDPGVPGGRRIDCFCVA